MERIIALLGRPIADAAGTARWGSRFLFGAALAVPVLVAQLLTSVELTGPLLLGLTLLVLDTSLLCVLVGLLLPLYSGRDAR